MNDALIVILITDNNKQTVNSGNERIPVLCARVTQEHRVFAEFVAFAFLRAIVDDGTIGSCERSQVNTQQRWRFQRCGPEPAMVGNDREMK